VLPGALELTAIDVGQGESLLLALPSGRLLMVDGGGLPGYGRALRSRLEIGEDVVSPYLWSRSIRRLDALVLTHVHEDHMNGLAALLENFAPRELWTGATAETPGWRALREAAQRRGVRILPLRRGRPFESGGARFEVLAPAADYAPGAAARNNDSLVLRVRFGRHAFLLTGDIERQVERELLNGSALQSDLLKVAHHGSRTSTTQGFLDAVRPPFALISAGFENAYRYPHPDVLARLAGRGARVLRTDLDGAISVWSDGTRLRVETARDNRRVRGGLYRPF
jgi:competence protein ComEC